MVLLTNISHVIQFEKEKNEFKYQEMLTATMSHEMMTPLNAVQGMSKLIDKKLKTELLHNL